jgi:KUP system potassium uptake protein
MVLTTLMIGFVMFRIWHWKLAISVPLFAILLTLDLGLFAASATKFADGGWLPACIAALMVLLFETWRRGRALLSKSLAADATAIPAFLDMTKDVRRIPATAVFLTSNKDGVPPALLHNLKANHVLHERVVLVTIETAFTPRVEPEAQITEEDCGGGITRVVLRYGFSESPDVPAALARLKEPCTPMKASYFLSRQTLVPSKRPGMALWREHLFAAMMRNSQSPMSYFKLPVNKVVELGSQVEI